VGRGAYKISKIYVSFTAPGRFEESQRLLLVTSHGVGAMVTTRFRVLTATIEQLSIGEIHGFELSIECSIIGQFYLLRPNSPAISMGKNTTDVRK
jgi:hypothetical protein